MPGNSGTVSLPTQGPTRAIAGRGGVGFPAPIPGGIGGVAPVPSRLSSPPPPRRTGPVPGGHFGLVELFRACIDFVAPFGLGANEGYSIRSVDGTPIQWLRGFYPNVAGAESFIPQPFATPSWSANAVSAPPGEPTVPIPTGHKHYSTGGYFREAYVNEQLFDQLTDRRHPWPIQKPVPFHLRAQVRGQPQQTRPYWYRLTRYQPAASYGQTTPTLLSAALSNLLPVTPGGNNPRTLGGNQYGSYG